MIHLACQHRGLDLLYPTIEIKMYSFNCIQKTFLYYKSLNIRVALIRLEIWNDQDKITVTNNPYSTLGAFLAWRRKQLPNDNAQLVTSGTIIGLAPLKAMCSEYQSGGVNSDHSNSAVGVAATMAHEMGHNFGMSHDSPGYFPFLVNRHFKINSKELKRYLSSGGGKCLFNPPNTRVMYGGQRCGNGYLEEGEECDCGEVEVRREFHCFPSHLLPRCDFD
uniref:ADAM metallopeptidase domain 19b n=1 Tax=Sinocyclocheilus anshuiensis TaxID=1608454 RepID=A0A671LRL5_9TELE